MKKPVKLVLALVGVVAAALLVVSFYLTYKITTSRNNQSVETQIVEIKSGSSIGDIARQLADKKLIDSTVAFEFYARFGPARGRLLPGPYALSANMSIKKIVEKLAAGDLAVAKITVPEGVTVNRIARLWVASGAGNEADFKAALKLDYGYDFLKDRMNPSSLEGYLAPATYQVGYQAKPRELIEKMLLQFEKTVRPVLYGANESGLSPAQVLTLASIVEAEANNTVDRKLVAGIFLNRLEQGIKLQSDVTVNYVTGKTATRPEDLLVDSRYNTYIYKGLTPGPINNPSLNAIEAVLRPTRTDYLFFIAGKDGKMYYARTNDEHEANIDRYLK